ncbi:hypothetical protein ABEKA_3275 (plasmid) [Acinetobacter lwoffii]|nr:hypothetical protein ABEKA_3275 [Acinetobacter lwoffii]
MRGTVKKSQWVSKSQIEKASSYNWLFIVTYKSKTFFEHTKIDVPRHLRH